MSAQGWKRNPYLTGFCVFCVASLVGSLLFLRYSSLTFDFPLRSVKQRQVVTYQTPTKSASFLFINDTFIPRNVSLFDGITRIIHQSWKTKTLPSERMKKWSQTWRDCFPNWTYKLWTDEDNLNFIKLYYPWFLKRYNAFPSNIMRVDSVRYFYMLHYGGIYADLDTECIRPFEPLLNASIVLGAMEGHWVEHSDIGHIQNSFMYSRPGKTYWLENVIGIYSRRKIGGVEDTTGPLLMMRLLKRYKERGHKDVMVYPGKYFNPFSWLKNKNGDCSVMGGMDDKRLKKCRDSFKEAYVVQYHTKTWAGGRARLR